MAHGVAAFDRHICIENLSVSSPPTVGIDNDRVNTGNPNSPSDVLYCHYPFLVVDNIHNIQPNDLNFLELQGCLRVPTRDLLNEFLQQYFLHVHPILPLVDERDFWNFYSDDAENLPMKQIPLLVFQAILFASCTFVSPSTVRRLGFSSTRVMRASYYRRAKLLYDLGSETPPLSIAQASLLLTFTSLSASRKPNISWLTIAIENAKIAEAHLYASIPASSILPNERNILKRVWWCCILRDRSTGLLMRRPIQITKHHFHFTSHPLCVADLEDEFERSRVYDPATKRRLAEILAHWIELNIALTDILMLVSPLDEKQDASPGKRYSDTNQLYECKSALKRWYNAVVPRFSFHFPGSESHSSVQMESDIDKYHPSVILYTHLMLMYYFTSCVVLSHYEILQRDMLQRSSHARSALRQGLSTIANSHQELKDAAACITLCHHELVSRGLDRWLPVSAIGCTAFPLILHILDTKLAPRNDSIVSNNSAPSDQTQNQFHALAQVMKTYQVQYDGVDWVTEIVDHIISLSQVDELGPTMEESSINWTDILVFQPDSYLRLALALDLSLRKGRLAEDGDFPARLRGLFAAELNPLKSLVKSHETIIIEESHDDLISFSGTLDPSAVFANDYGRLPQERSPPSSSHENILETLETEVYLQLIGGVTDKNVPSLPDTTIPDI